MIYVDALVAWPQRASSEQARRWFGEGKESCHMFADSDDELLAFARRLRLAPHYIQRSPRWPTHFDLTPSKRTLAVKLGAKEITREEYLVLYHRHKKAIEKAIS